MYISGGGRAPATAAQLAKELIATPERQNGMNCPAAGQQPLGGACLESSPKP